MRGFALIYAYTHSRLFLENFDAVAIPKKPVVSIYFVNLILLFVYIYFLFLCTIRNKNQRRYNNFLFYYKFRYTYIEIVELHPET